MVLIHSTLEYLPCSGSARDPLHMFAHLMLWTTLCDVKFYYPHLRIEETESQITQVICRWLQIYRDTETGSDFKWIRLQSLAPGAGIWEGESSPSYKVGWMREKGQECEEWLKQQRSHWHSTHYVPGAIPASCKCLLTDTFSFLLSEECFITIILDEGTDSERLSNLSKVTQLVFDWHENQNQVCLTSKCPSKTELCSLRRPSCSDNLPLNNSLPRASTKLTSEGTQEKLLLWGMDKVIREGRQAHRVGQARVGCTVGTSPSIKRSERERAR